MRLFALTVLACALCADAECALVVFGDSFSDDDHGASPVVREALSTAQVGGDLRSLLATFALLTVLLRS